MSNKGHKGVTGCKGIPVEDRIDPGFDLSNDQLANMVEEALEGCDFSSVIDSYFRQMEDEITHEILTANAESDGGYNLSSAAGCRFLAERIVNNVLRPPRDEKE